MRRCHTIVVATTTSAQDDILVACLESMHIPYVRGSEEDVLGRFQQVADQLHPDIIIRVTADCPLLDPRLVDQLVEQFLQVPAVDYASNTLERTFPRGMDVEIFTAKALKEAADEAQLPYQREHVTPFFYQQPGRFALRSVCFKEDASRYRWTVDEPADFVLIETLLSNIYPKNPCFTLEDLLALAKKHPEWEKINRDVQQKSL